MSLVRRTVDAATRPLHLVVPAAGVVVAGGLIAVQVAPLALVVGALSALTWGGLVAFDVVASRPAGPPPAPVKLPFRSARLAALVDAVHKAAEPVQRRVDAHDGVLAGSLAELAADCQALIDSAETAARRGDALFGWLSDTDPAQLLREVQARTAEAREARDKDAAKALRAAADAKQRQLETWRALNGLYERVQAELLATEAALDEIEARVVRLTLMDPEQAASEPPINAGLGALRDRLGTLEKNVAATLQEMA